MEAVITASTAATKDPQTHDFMNVDSFSQLPFIRPTTTTTTKAKLAAAANASGIRLFGIDFSTTTARNSDSDESSTDNHHDISGRTDPSATNNGGGAGESSRKFECHYCCRNFPTSQALGGHQNAHKRERQHAKRANLHHHSATMIAAGDHHLYGYPHHRTINPSSYYHPSTPHSSFTTTRFSSNSNFSLHRHTPPTINGSPLAVFRLPTAMQPHHHHLNGVRRDSSSMQPVPLFSGSGPASRVEYPGPKMMMGRIENSGQVTGFDDNDQFHRRTTGHENVSLDLRL